MQTFEEIVKHLIDWRSRDLEYWPISGFGVLADFRLFSPAEKNPQNDCPRNSQDHTQTIETCHIRASQIQRFGLEFTAALESISVSSADGSDDARKVQCFKDM
jgi:hypothetical protein